MEKFFLTKPAIVSSIGEGIKEHIDILLNNTNSPLHSSNKVFSSHGLIGKSGVFGEVNSHLREFPENLSQIHKSRNNQLLWHTLEQIESQIQTCIQHVGKNRIATIIGTSTTGVDENISLFKYGAIHNDWAGEYFNQQQQYFSAPADFIAEVYDLKGLTYGISTACTSGARALISAARLLKNNLCDAVICGGVDTLSPLTISGFNSLSVLSEKQTNPFSINRDGINIGEGSAIFIMTREPLDEENDNNIQFLGYGSSSDAYHMSSPHPEGEGAISAFKTALKTTALSPEQIGWINLHGTGTVQNDQMESIAVSEVFGNQIPCTTTKPYTGHTLGAAGAIEAAILWGIISRKYNPTGKLPAQLWDKKIDPNIQPIHITDKNSVWKNNVRIGASSSFAFGGNNSVLILGES